MERRTRMHNSSHPYSISVLNPETMNITRASSSHGRDGFNLLTHRRDTCIPSSQGAF